MILVAPKKVSDIKRAQKERLLFREISQLFQHATLEDARLRDFWISRVSLSADKSICYVFFVTQKGIEYFNEMLGILKLYKPSLRKAIADAIASRYTPEIVFKYDDQYEKVEKINQLIDRVKTE